MKGMFDKKIADLSRLGGKKETISKLEDFLDENIDILDHVEKSSLCHNDLNPGNIMGKVEDGRIKINGIIDVLHSVLADPLLDFIRIYNRLGEKEGEYFSNGYGPTFPENWDTIRKVYEVYIAVENWTARRTHPSFRKKINGTENIDKAVINILD